MASLFLLLFQVETEMHKYLKNHNVWETKGVV